MAADNRYANAASAPTQQNRSDASTATMLAKEKGKGEAKYRCASSAREPCLGKERRGLGDLGHDE